MNPTRNFLLLIGVFIHTCTFGQNFDKIGKKDAVTVSGGLNFNTVTYFQKGLTKPNREPFTWFASGNLNINILGVALPFTYTYSNVGGKFTQPFNRTALHPQYKWAKAHIGMVNMNFSPYTLQGHLFLGGGLELTPGNWKIKLMGGRLKKKIEYDPGIDNVNEISYNRFGYGVNAAYSKKGYSGEISILKAYDKPTSLPFIPINSTVKPQDNLVISVKGKGRIIKNLNVEAEYAISGLTQNVNYPDEANLNVNNSNNIFYRLIQGNETTEFFNAFNTSLNYSIKTFNLAFKFEHIDPGYTTLGGYYFNNDLQNYTLAPSFTLFKKKVKVALNTGFQRNNLSQLEAGTTNRWIGSANISYVPTSKLIFTANYSNFSTFTRNRPVGDPFYYQPADTLNFYQLTQNGMAMISYNFGEGDIKSALQLVYNYQESTNLSGNIADANAFGLGIQTDLQGVPTRVHMGNLAYTSNFTKINGSLTFAANVNQSYLIDQNSTFIGPTLNFQKSIFNKKGSFSLGSTYNRQYTNNTLASNVFNHRTSFTWSPSLKNENLGKFNLSANGNWMQRFATTSSLQNISEILFYINLGYSF